MIHFTSLPLPLVILVIAVLLVSSYAQKYEITNLPGYKEDLPSKMYSGYLHASDSTRLFFIYVEAEDLSPETAPITAWFNGGPGCSSLDGFWEELGPFEVNKKGGLDLRPYRWNRLSNMLFIESPVGVGLSYSLDENYINNDDRTATENAEALDYFFTALFPELKTNSFYLSGESYAGVYVPTLAEEILDRIKIENWNGPNIKGILVGNGCTGKDTGICGFYEGNSCDGLYYEYLFLSGLSFFDNDIKDKIQDECDWNTCVSTPANTTMPDGWAGKQNFTLTNDCIDLIDDAFLLLGHINIYDVFGKCDNRDYCNEDEGTTVTYSTVQKSVAARTGDVHMNTDGKGRASRLREGLQKFRRNLPETETAATSTSTRYLPEASNDDAFFNEVNKTEGPAECIGSYNAAKWMNANYKHLHGVKNFCWGVCNRTPTWQYNSTRENLPRDLYPRLIGNMDVTIYNGDVDSCVPYTDNEAWTENMGYSVSEAWHPWSFTDWDPTTLYGNQVGGYKVVYNVTELKNDNDIAGQGKFQFVTVRGAGHMVPQTQPAAALELFKRFIGLENMELKPHSGVDYCAEFSYIKEIIEDPAARATMNALLVVLVMTLTVLVFYWLKSKYLQNVVDDTTGIGVQKSAGNGFSNKLDISDRDVTSGMHSYNDINDGDDDTTIEFSRLGTQP